jgi:hypothetical protein
MLNFQSLVRSVTTYFCLATNFCPMLGRCLVFSVKIKVEGQVFELMLTPFCWNRHKNQIVELGILFLVFLVKFEPKTKIMDKHLNPNCD